jgi:hypothetical protein
VLSDVKKLDEEEGPCRWTNRLVKVPDWEDVSAWIAESYWDFDKKNTGDQKCMAEKWVQVV